MNHKEILEKAKRLAFNPKDIPKIETLHQNLAHMTIALKEVETRLLRVANKANRHKFEDTEPYCVPLAKCIEVIKKQISETQQYLKIYDNFN